MAVLRPVHAPRRPRINRVPLEPPVRDGHRARPAGPPRSSASRVLGSGAALAFSTRTGVIEQLAADPDGEVTITVPERDLDPFATVLAIDLAPEPIEGRRPVARVDPRPTSPGHDPAGRARRRPDVRPPLRAVRARRGRGRRPRRPSDAQPAGRGACSRAGERIDVLATHSKYAPSQAQWLRPLDDLVDAAAVAPLAPRAVELCRFDGVQLCLPRLIDVRVLWARTDRVETVPDTWDGAGRLRRGLRVPRPRVGLVRRRSSSWSSGAVGACSTTSSVRRWPHPKPSTPIETLCVLACPRTRRARRLALRRGRRRVARRPRRRGRGVAGRLRRDPRVAAGRAPATPPLPRRARTSRVVLRVPRVGDPAHVRRPRRRGRAWSTACSARSCKASTRPAATCARTATRWQLSNRGASSIVAASRSPAR